MGQTQPNNSVWENPAQGQSEGDVGAAFQALDGLFAFNASDGGLRFHNLVPLPSGVQLPAKLVSDPAFAGSDTLATTSPGP